MSASPRLQRLAATMRKILLRDPGWEMVGLSYAILIAVVCALFVLAELLQAPCWTVGESRTWLAGQGPVALLRNEPGFCVLSEVSGKFLGSQESVGLSREKDGSWQLRGQSGEKSLSATALPIHTQGKPVTHEHIWNTTNPPIKLIHERDGFPFLSSVRGGLHGAGEAAWLWLDSDGIWWLGGRSQQTSLSVKAMTVRTGRKLPTTTFRVKDLGVPTRLIHRNQGICFLSGISGKWDGTGEHAGLRIRNDGYWYLELKRGNDSAWAEATAVFFDKDYIPDWDQLGADLNEMSQWESTRGRWASQAGGIQGTGDGELRFRSLLPQDLKLKFKIKAAKGSRPRILVNSMACFYVGDEGDQREMFVHGPWLADPKGTPRLYRQSDPIDIELRFFRELAEVYVDGQLLARGIRVWPSTWELILMAGDKSSPGVCSFSDFEVGPVLRSELTDTLE